MFQQLYAKPNIEKEISKTNCHSNNTAWQAVSNKKT